MEILHKQRQQPIEKNCTGAGPSMRQTEAATSGGEIQGPSVTEEAKKSDRFQGLERSRENPAG